MNRPIKFRSWDTQDKVFVLDWMSFVETSISEGWGNPWRDTRFIPMQFTGLLDKNGKEIYEADVVKENGFVSTVAWNDRHSRFVLMFQGGKREYTEWAFMKSAALDIIGNIYENPELTTPS